MSNRKQDQQEILLIYKGPASAYSANIGEPQLAFLLHVVKGERLKVPEQVYDLLLQKGHIAADKLKIATSD